MGKGKDGNQVKRTYCYGEKCKGRRTHTGATGRCSSCGKMKRPPDVLLSGK